MKPLSFLYFTRKHIAGLVLRLTLAFVLLPHGCQLLFGWFGGFGFQGSMAYFTQVEGLPWIIGATVILIQFLGALLLIVGYLGRFVSLSIIVLFIGMIITSHWDHGFFMNWMGTQKGEGFEYHILVIGMALAIALHGSGSASLDIWLSHKLQSEINNY